MHFEIYDLRKRKKTAGTLCKENSIVLNKVQTINGIIKKIPTIPCHLLSLAFELPIALFAISLGS